MPTLRRTLAVLALTMVGATASAHGLRVTVQAEAEGVRGQALYSDGTPARQEPVALFRAEGGAPLAATITDGDGRFRMPLAAAGSYRIVVDDGEGHRAESGIVWLPLPPPAAAVDAAALAAAVRAEMAPLREDLARLEARTRLADLVGGVGIVFGLFGAWAWWRARTRR